jgi:transposase-like protein
MGVHHGDHGEEEEEDVTTTSVVHPGIQGRDRRALCGWRSHDRPGGPGLRPDRDRRARLVHQAEIDAGQRDGLTTEERQELSRLRREVKSLRLDVEVLKRATAFFAKETR